MSDAQRKPPSRRSLDLFEAGRRDALERDQPLAARLRPRTLDEFVGQDHILGPGRLLRRAIQADQLSSLIFHGPPGTGKTTLAAVIANTTKSHFISINAVLSGVADIRSAVEEAQERRQLHGHRTTLFIDEVHRFNKAQQDALLPWVENGTVVLIGATTENPYFSVNRPLVSRSRLFQLRELEAGDLHRIARQALQDPRGYADVRVDLHEDAVAHLVDVCSGDARALLNALELAVETTPRDAEGVVHLDLAVAEESIQRRAVLYDKEGDYHFDTISALIKSLRGSDPDAAVYWLARMVYAGEDPHFLFRRMLIFASEDVGLADPEALGVVTAAAEAFDRVGLPEGRFHLAHAALYLATAPKSNSTLAFFDALAAVEAEGDGEVPNPLKDASRDAEGLGHGAGYLYPHAYRDHWVAQQYLPDSLHGRLFYQPSDQGRERDLGDRVRRRRELQLAAAAEAGAGGVDPLTHSPEDRSRDQWLVRAAGEVSAQLDHVRQRLFASLRLARHHVVLDLDAASGLLTWEALRRVPEGGVWSLCTDRTSAVALREMASLSLDELSRPVVLEGPVTRAAELVRLQDESLRFDAVLGRNTLGSVSGREKEARRIVELLAPGAALSLAETVPRLGQRLTALVPVAELGEDLAERLHRAEEDIYRDEDNPRVAWEPADLEPLWSEAGLTSVRVETEVLTASRRLGSRELGRWFSPGGEKHDTFAAYLRRHLCEDEVRQVRRLFESKLMNREVDWSTTYAYVSGRAAVET